jgi:hypothetical protein
MRFRYLFGNYLQRPAFRSRVSVGAPPDHRVALHQGEIAGRKVQSDEWRVGPVQKPRRQTVMLSERDPVPDGGRLIELAVGVLLKAVHQAVLDGPDPETELQLLLNQLKLQLPDQPPPRITAAGHLAP